MGALAQIMFVKLGGKILRDGRVPPSVIRRSEEETNRAYAGLAYAALCGGPGRDPGLTPAGARFLVGAGAPGKDTRDGGAAEALWAACAAWHVNLDVGLPWWEIPRCAPGGPVGLLVGCLPASYLWRLAAGGGGGGGGGVGWGWG